MTPAQHLAAAEELIETAREVYDDAVDEAAVDDLTRFFVESLTGMAQVHATLAAIPQRFR